MENGESSGCISSTSWRTIAARRATEESRSPGPGAAPGHRREANKSEACGRERAEADDKHITQPPLGGEGAEVASPLPSHLERGALWEMGLLTPARTRPPAPLSEGDCSQIHMQTQTLLLSYFSPSAKPDRRRAISGATPTRTPFILRGTRLVTTTRRGRLRRNGGK